MDQIDRYELVSDINATDFTQKVNDLIGKGFQPLGGPYTGRRKEGAEILSDVQPTEGRRPGPESGKKNTIHRIAGLR